MMRRCESCRAVVKYYEAVVADADAVRRFGAFAADMVRWMAIHDDVDTKHEYEAIWSDVVTQTLLDARLLSDELAEIVQVAEHAAIIQSLHVSLKRATAGDLDGSLSISYGFTQSNESLARELLSGDRLPVR